MQVSSVNTALLCFVRRQTGSFLTLSNQFFPCLHLPNTMKQYVMGSNYYFIVTGYAFFSMSTAWRKESSFTHNMPKKTERTGWNKLWRKNDYKRLLDKRRSKWDCLRHSLRKRDDSVALTNRHTAKLWRGPRGWVQRNENPEKRYGERNVDSRFHYSWRKMDVATQDGAGLRQLVHGIYAPLGATRHKTNKSHSWP